MNILIVGASGYVGGRLAALLAERGEDLVLLARDPGPLTARFPDARIVRAKPDWDMTVRDYSLAPDSPAYKLGFQPIDATQIGLAPDFPFDKLAATRRHAAEKIQAEDYQADSNQDVWKLSHMKIAEDEITCNRKGNMRADVNVSVCKPGAYERFRASESFKLPSTAPTLSVCPTTKTFNCGSAFSFSSTS